MPRVLNKTMTAAHHRGPGAYHMMKAVVSRSSDTLAIGSTNCHRFFSSAPEHDFILSHPSSVDGPNPTRGRVVCITSGKGGVGKTTSAASFAMGLADRGHKTCVVDFE